MVNACLTTSVTVLVSAETASCCSARLEPPDFASTGGSDGGGKPDMSGSASVVAVAPRSTPSWSNCTVGFLALSVCAVWPACGATAGAVAGASGEDIGVALGKPLGGTPRGGGGLTEGALPVCTFICVLPLLREVRATDVPA